MNISIEQDQQFLVEILCGQTRWHAYSLEQKPTGYRVAENPAGYASCAPTCAVIS
jgi:hypothetical protein